MYRLVVNHSKQKNAKIEIMNFLKKLFNAFIFALNQAKKKLPFIKILFICDSNNWINVNYNAIIRSSLCTYRVVERIKFIRTQNCHQIEIKGDFKKQRHKGINLYCVSEYNICVKLEVFPSDISFSKEEHRKVITEWFSISAGCIDFYEKLIAKNKPQKILISQGHNFDAAVIRALSCIHGFDIVAVENTFNKNKIVWDDVSGITVNKNLAKNYFWKYRDIVEESTATSYVSNYLKNIKNIKSTEHQTPVVPVSASTKKTVLFIGQVYTDSSVLFGLNDFECPEDIVECLADYCIENNYHLIVKLHPKEAIGIDTSGKPYNDLTYKKIGQKLGLLEKTITNNFVLDKGAYDTYALIEIADVCVTINSQAGLEALIKGKDLIVCGQSSYSGLGFTFEALNKNDLIYSLSQVLLQGLSVLNHVEVNKFFYIISKKYFMDRNENSIKQLLIQ